MSLFSDSWRLFNSRNIYDVLNVPPESMARQIREAAYELIMDEHPEVKTANQRKESLEKCRLIYQILHILMDSKRRADYDQRGHLSKPLTSIETTKGLNNLLQLCSALMKLPLGLASSRENFRRHYKGSLLELSDIKAAYMKGKGSLTRLYKDIPLMTVGDEPRMVKTINQLIKVKDLPAYDKFIKDTPEQRRRRHSHFAPFTAEEEQNDTINKILIKYSNDSDMEAFEDYDDQLITSTHSQPSDVLLSNYNGDMKLVMSNLSLKYESEDNYADDYEKQLQMVNSRCSLSKINGSSILNMGKSLSRTVVSKFSPIFKPKPIQKSKFRSNRSIKLHKK